MTPREPDRFDKIARDITRQWDDVGTTGIEDILAAALRTAESSALERAAQDYERAHSYHRGLHGSLAVAAHLRALASPAAAPSAITYVNAEQWAAAGQPPLDDKKPREPGCQCHQEEGDSPCPVHGEEEPAPLLPRVLAALEIIDRQGTIGVTTLIRSLAAELRAYIAERATPHSTPGDGSAET